MKNTLKILLKWAIAFVVCFGVIYLLVFIGGWQLFESGDPILIEVGASVILSFFVLIFGEIVLSLEKRIKVLEEKLAEFESASYTKTK